MIIWTVVEVDYPNGTAMPNVVHAWSFDDKNMAEKFAKKMQSKYSPSDLIGGYRHNTVNVFRNILNEE